MCGLEMFFLSKEGFQPLLVLLDLYFLGREGFKREGHFKPCKYSSWVLDLSLKLRACFLHHVWMIRFNVH